MNTRQNIADDVKIGDDVYLGDFINLYGCTIGNHCKIGPFVEIQKDVTIGDYAKIQSHTFICSGVSIDDGVFIGHNVTFINDRAPRSRTAEGVLATEKDWKLERTVIEKDVTIGSSATIMCGVTIGEGAMIGAGSVVTKNVAAHTTVVGVPARVLKKKHIEPEQVTLINAVPKFG